MEADAQVARVAGVEQPVLDHLCRRPHQPEGVRVVLAFVAGDVEHAEQLAVGRDQRRRGAGQEAVAFQEVLAAMHHQRPGFGQRGADRVGAAVPLVPGGAGRQGDALGPAQEVGIAERLEQHALLVGQRHHAARLARLRVQVLHHRARVGDQIVTQLPRACQLGVVEPAGIRQAAVGSEAGIDAAPPGAGQQGADQVAERQFAALEHQVAGAAQGGTVGAGVRRHGMASWEQAKFPV